MAVLPAALDRELSCLLGEGWRSDADTRARHAGDASRNRALPLGVALPSARGQVEALVRLAQRHRIPLVARGAATSSTGAALAGDAIAVSFERMDRILDVRPDDRLAVVEPGVVNAVLQRALEAHGLFWPPDPASADTCTIGGNLACNAGGPRTLKYGASRDNVLGLVAVTGTGDTVRVGAATSKSATGYDLTRLLVGSEGTLALIVEATLRLTPLPSARASLRALYDDAASAAAAVARIMRLPSGPAMLEFMDAACIRLARDVGGADIPEAGALLMIEADGDPQALAWTVDALEAAARGPGLRRLDHALDPGPAAQLWAARRALSQAQRAIAPAKLNEDVVVPVPRIPELVDGIQALAHEFAVPIIAFGHAGNGNLHANILYDPSDAAQSARAHAALPRLFALALSLGGTLSGEHGIGTAKRGFMAQAYDAPTLAAMRAVKAAFDPDGILNPGKVLPPA